MILILFFIFCLVDVIFYIMSPFPEKKNIYLCFILGGGFYVYYKTRNSRNNTLNKQT